MSIKSIFSSYMDRMIHPSLHEDELLATKSRMIIGLLSINTPLVLITCIVAFLVRESHHFYVLALAYMLTLSIGFIASLLILKFLGRYVLSASITLILLNMAIFGGIYATGGPSTSSFNVFLLFIPFFSFLFIGKKIGLITIISVLLVEMTMVTLSYLGYEFPQVPLPFDKDKMDFACWFLSYFVVCEIIFFYERNSSRLQQQLTEEKDLFEHMACHDPLTDIDNRVLFSEKLETAIFRAERNQSNVAVLYIDLDGFKPINDQHGHNAGDQVLVAIAKRLSKNIRIIDSVARIGGDEFAILMEDVKSTNDVKVMVNKVSLLIADPVQVDNKSLQVFSSIGISQYPMDADSPEQLTKIADLAMYKAKEAKSKNTSIPEDYTGQAFFAHENELMSFRAG